MEVLAKSVRSHEESRSVAPIELFFDLVFVFAVTQLSHHLVDHFDLRTAAETAILTLAVVYAWYMTAWLSNWLSPTRVAVQALLLTLMLASLLMSSAISGAFASRAWMFAGAYVAIQLVRAGFAVAAFGAGTPQRRHFENDLGWEVVTGVIWLAGAAAHGDGRLALWALAVAITLIGVGLAHPVPGRSSHLVTRVGAEAAEVHSDLRGEHLLERLRLFFLIVLGETLLTTGAAFAGHEIGAGALAAFLSAFVASVAIWWCWFQRAEPAGLAASASAADASGVALLGTWALTLAVLGIIGMAVADELAIAHPGYPAGIGHRAVAFGGPALFLLGQLLFLWRVGAGGLWPRAAGIATLVVLTPVLSGSLLLVSVVATLLLVGVAASDVRYGDATS